MKVSDAVLVDEGTLQNLCILLVFFFFFDLSLFYYTNHRQYGHGIEVADGCNTCLN